jgi:hypothetical protein
MQDCYNLHVYIIKYTRQFTFCRLILVHLSSSVILLCSEEYYSGGYYASPEDAYTYTAHAQHVLSSSPTAHAPHGLSSSAHAPHGLSSSAHSQHVLSSSPTAHALHALSSSAHAQHLLSSSPYHNGEDMRASASQMYRNEGAHQKCGFSVLVQNKNHQLRIRVTFMFGYKYDLPLMLIQIRRCDKAVMFFKTFLTMNRLPLIIYR